MSMRFGALLSALAACGGGAAAPDAGDGGAGLDARAGIIDAGPLPDRIDPLLWVELSATGCSSGGADGEPCTGPAPLAVQFTAIAPAPISTYVWSFGDGSPTSSEAAPLHVYELPGTYDVALTVSGPGGTATAMHGGFIVAHRAAVGAPCTDSAQCAVGLGCVCDGSATCAPALADGVCSAPCGPGAPCDDGVCVELAAGGAADPEPWQQALCLQGCASTPDCRDGFACRELLSAAAATWVQACFPPALLGGVGASCAQPDGALSGAACAGGVCADAGARGMCTASCGACPSYAACATFAGPLGAICLARCSAERPCDGDPWLACEQPGGAGPAGFTVGEPAVTDGYCAPKSCTTPDDCGPDGACTGGTCGPG